MCDGCINCSGVEASGMLNDDEISNSDFFLDQGCRFHYVRSVHLIDF